MESLRRSLLATLRCFVISEKDIPQEYRKMVIDLKISPQRVRKAMFGLLRGEELDIFLDSLFSRKDEGV